MAGRAPTLRVSMVDLPIVWVKTDDEEQFPIHLHRFELWRQIGAHDIDRIELAEAVEQVWSVHDEEELQALRDLAGRAVPWPVAALVSCGRLIARLLRRGGAR